MNGWACASSRNPPVDKQIINKAIEAARAREAARKARELTRARRAGMRGGLPASWPTAAKRPPDAAKLYLVAV